MNIETDQSLTVKGLKKEGEHIQHKIEADKSIIKADFQKIQYSILGSVIREILGLFSSKKKARPKASAKPKTDEKPKATAKTRPKKEKS